MKSQLKLTKRVVIYILIFWGLGISAQSPLIYDDDLDFDNAFSYVLNMGDIALINYQVRKADPFNKIHIAYTKQVLVHQHHGIIKNTVIDSSNMNGLGIHLHQSVELDQYLYHFGGLYRHDYKDFGMIVRKTDKNLNLTKDTNFAFSNRGIWVTSAVADSSNILIAGTSFKPEDNFSALFLLRMDTALNLLDTSLFYIPVAFRYKPVIYTNQNDLFLKATNYVDRVSILLQFDRKTLTFQDTIFAYGLSGYQPIWLINPYGTILDSNHIISPYELVRNGQSTIHSTVGWFKWSLSGPFQDTILPFKNQIVPSRIGTRASSLIHYDTLVQIYAHNLNEYTYPPNDSSIMAMMF